MRTIRWFRLLPGGLALLTMAWILATRWSVVLASHPAYLVTVAVVVVVAGFACLTGIRAPRTEDRARRRWAVLLTRTAGLAVAALVVGGLVYLRPFATTAPARLQATDSTVTVVESATRIELRPRGAAKPTGVVFWPGPGWTHARTCPCCAA